MATYTELIHCKDLFCGRILLRTHLLHLIHRVFSSTGAAVVPSPDGSLYLSLNSGSLSKIPTSIGDLANYASSSSSTDGTTLVFSNSVTNLLRMELYSGEALFHCPINALPALRPGASSSPSKTSDVAFHLPPSSLPVLTTFTNTHVTVVDSVSSSFLWNVTLASFSSPSAVSVSCINPHSPRISGNLTKSTRDLLHSFSFLLCHLKVDVEGSLYLSIRKQLRWKRQLDSPVVKMMLITDPYDVLIDSSEPLVLTVEDPLVYYYNNSRVCTATPTTSSYVYLYQSSSSLLALPLSPTLSCSPPDSIYSKSPLPGLYELTGLDGNLAFDSHPPGLPRGIHDQQLEPDPFISNYKLFVISFIIIFLSVIGFVLLHFYLLKRQPSSFTLSVSHDEVLGHGSCGTTIFKGELADGRVVAIKRLLHTFFELATSEINALLSSDSHPNIVSYYGFMKKGEFVYLALELCESNLADFFKKNPDLPVRERVKLAFDIIKGLYHLHSLNIVHRDLKPSNILLSKSVTVNKYSAKLSDMGLSRPINPDESHFSTVFSNGGSEGWRAPEVIESTGSKARFTKAVDVFGFGCLLHYILTGSHPFGKPHHREYNITEGLVDISTTIDPLAANLIRKCLYKNPCNRPDTKVLLIHPFFWDEYKTLNFLLDVSDRVESEDSFSPIVRSLETYATNILGRDWIATLDQSFIDQLGRFRKYNARSVRDLLRVIRNKKHHYRDLPEDVRDLVGPLPGGYLRYFSTRFPSLVSCCFDFVCNFLAEDPMFEHYLGSRHYLGV
ncbi:hypothetical protein GEMRC1_001593 [Eukaryota sp. GEM-RC1]